MANVPRKAISMGVSTIMAARQVSILALGEGKGKIAKRAIEGDYSSDCPATYLHKHPNCTFFLDRASCA